jgi:hypothetical protein
LKIKIEDRRILGNKNKGKYQKNNTKLFHLKKFPAMTQRRRQGQGNDRRNRSSLSTEF